ncbi:MAG: 6-carboxytetrahydropterin synthase [Flavobacteriales bacterium]|jgi:6-pyruvoyltetrahydropterin/6-carboxytetrahydropterin synthase|tara:strand:+ start:2380 stop:2808 length:429 start_codon:yes stop_codon:yes gene_type:complete
MIYLTRRERFNAAHRLFRKEWTNEENYAVFGKCSNPNWHGHNYQLFVTIKGETNPETGFVINLNLLSKIVREKVIGKMDHKNLNLDVDFMKDKITSAENIAIAIWDEIVTDVNKLDCILHCIKVVETENNSIEYYGSGNART